MTKRKPAPIDWEKQFEEKIKFSSRIVFPDPKYQSDPVAFCREILGIEPWGKQIEILQAITEPNCSIAVKSGHKCGKSLISVVIALWFYCSFPKARVIMTSTTAHQVKNILWRELTMIYQKANSINPIGGTLSPLPSSGLKSVEHNQIIGFTAREPEGVAGISGANLLYILDEASGIPDNIYEAIEGNRAGGARIVLFSNPTRLVGEFYNAFNHPKKKARYKTFTISSEETPNVIAGKQLIPGLAVREYIEEKREEWGEDSPIYQVRIKGNFPNRDDCTVVPIHLIEEAIARSEDEDIDLSLPEYNGPFTIGLDVARFGDDESVLCFRQNLRVRKIVGVNGYDSKQLLQLLYTEYYKLTNGKQSAPGMLPTVIVDNTGGFASGVIDFIDRRQFNIRPINFSSKAHSENYVNMRAQMWFNIETFLKSGPVILPNDDKLSHELSVVKYFFTAKGARQIESKDDIKKLLKRSPDRADALALSLENLTSANRTITPPAQRIVPVKPLSPYNTNLSPYGKSISPYSSG